MTVVTARRHRRLAALLVPLGLAGAGALPAAEPPVVASAVPATTPGDASRPPPGGPTQVALEATEVRGNQELPKVLYIVPWKDPAMVEVVGRPVNSLVDEALAPVDRDVFRRQGRYFGQLYGAGRDAPEGNAGAGAPAD